MRQVTLNIPDTRYQFFLELVSSIDFVKENNESILIPGFHKEIVSSRMEKSHENPERLLDWEEAKSQIKME